jgi:dienelactone hydrolase
VTVNFVKSPFPDAELDELRFTVGLDGSEPAPGLLVAPREAASPVPLVIIQHPATSSKDEYFVREVGRMWARKGWACAGLDAPYHGERATFDPMRVLRDREAFPTLAHQFGAELTAAVDAIASERPIDMARLGFVGYSMGSMLGIPAIAADGRFRAAALCLIGEGGLVGEAGEPGSPVSRLAGVAVRIVAKERDEFFSKGATEGLFRALPGPEKDLVWLPGGHFEIGPDVIRAAEEWLAAKL